ncbi:molybdopterin-dependent oxidoreductase [Hymenobacter endophyticus]|uniref:Molybdopterin-dependent oxidoreductase n=1 Tax=Hymenobacter endophyticus TaxID=3076335 RepID=A0ABU3TFC2_9BACT|nr:molybdopterin-dependent oxidoreductase [Hymenobacter endophyticus]MDU0370063.1 molybdopterin-dependent oxidoreductase [Hymenobacter endophyticus]
MSANMPEKPLIPADDAALAEVRRRSRRSFLVGGTAAVLGLLGWRWASTGSEADGISRPLRSVLDANGQLAGEYFSSAHLAPVYPKSRARMPRTNGRVGLKTALDPAAWRLRVTPSAGGAAREFTLADIQALPRIEMTTELKCIEGWSTVVTWAGARFADFLARFPLADAAAPFVNLTTPDGKYYVGLDMASALHPQTLLCYEMNGAPLTPEHGAPLRLVTPVKYGIKHIKRLGTISFPPQRPADYWADRGYDWHSGL